MTTPQSMEERFDQKFIQSKKGWKGHLKQMIREAPDILLDFIRQEIAIARQEGFSEGYKKGERDSREAIDDLVKAERDLEVKIIKDLGSFDDEDRCPKWLTCNLGQEEDTGYVCNHDDGYYCPCRQDRIIRSIQQG